MAQEMTYALQVAENVATLYEESSARLWYPHLSLQWLGVPTGPFIGDDNGDVVFASGGVADEGVTDVGGDERLTVMEARQGLAERAFSFTLVKGRALPAGGLSMRYKTYAASASRMDLNPSDGKPSRPWTWGYWSEYISMLWSTERMLRLRVWLSKRHRAVQHSSHWRHGLKNAIGVAVLTFPAFMPEGSTGVCLTPPSSIRRELSVWQGDSGSSLIGASG